MNRGWRGRGRHPRGGQQDHGFRGANHGHGGGGFSTHGRSERLDLHGMGGGEGRPPPPPPLHLPNPVGTHDIPPHEPHHGHVGGGGTMDMGVTDFQRTVPNDMMLQDMEQDPPDYQWPPPDYQWPPGDGQDPNPMPTEQQHGRHRQTSPMRDQSSRDGAKHMRGPPPGHIDMFQPGPDEYQRRSPVRESRPRDQETIGGGNRRSLSPRHDNSHQLSDEASHRGGPGLPPPHIDHHLTDEIAQQAGSSMKDTESLRITIGNERFFGNRGLGPDQGAQNVSAFGRLGQRTESAPAPPKTSGDYGQNQRQSSLEREQRYRDRSEPDLEHVRRSRSSSLEKPVASMMRSGSNSKERERDSDQRGSRQERGNRESRDRDKDRSYHDDQRKDREKGRGRDADSDRRDDKGKESSRPRDPRKDKDFLAERTSKTSPLPPSDVSPLYHFLGKNDSRKQSTENNDEKKQSKSQKPGIPLPSKSRFATSTSQSSHTASSTQSIQCAPDVSEPPKVLKSILKKSILKKPKVSQAESTVTQEAPKQQLPLFPIGQSPPVTATQSPVTVQTSVSESVKPEWTSGTLQPQQMSASHQQDQMLAPGLPEQILAPLQPEPRQTQVLQEEQLFHQPHQLLNPPQREQSPMTTHATPESEPTQQILMHDPRQNVSVTAFQQPISTAPPELTPDKITKLLSSLTGMYQPPAPVTPAFSSISQSIDLQMLAQQLVQQPPIYSAPTPEMVPPQQSYPQVSQQLQQQSYPTVLQQQSYPAVSQQPFPAASQQPYNIGQQQSIQQLAQQLAEQLAQQPSMGAVPTLPLSQPQQMNPGVPHHTYQGVSQATNSAALTLDSVTTSKIWDLAHNIGQTSTTPSVSTQNLFPGVDPAALSKFEQLQKQLEEHKRSMTSSVQFSEAQMQNLSYLLNQTQNIFGQPQSQQQNLSMAKPVEKAPEPSRSISGFGSLEDEDLFLYGDGVEEKPNEQEKMTSGKLPSSGRLSRSSETQETEKLSKVKLMQPEQKVKAPSDDQIKNILSAIGFDFGLAQKIKEQKEQQEQGKTKKSKSNKPDTQAKQKIPKVPTETKVSTPVEKTAAPLTEEALNIGFNETASFLDGGIKMKTDQELNDFIQDAKSNVSKHRREHSETKDKASDSAKSRSEKRQDKPKQQDKGNIKSLISTNNNSQAQSVKATEDKYVTESAEIPNQDAFGQYPPREVPQPLPSDRPYQTQEVKYQESSGYNQLYQSAPTQQQAYYPSQPAPQYPPIEQTVQFVNTQDSFSVAAPAPVRDTQSFQPENIFISVNTAGDSSSGSNRVVLLPNSEQAYNDERQKRILEIERRYQGLTKPEELIKPLETEREKERRLRREAEELIENEKQRRREERKRKEEEERKKKEEERKKKEEEEREERRKREARKEREKELEKEREREEKLRFESLSFEARIDILETELEKLCKQQGEISRQRRQKDGQKETALLQNKQSQDDIANQLRYLRRKMNQEREDAKNKRVEESRKRSRSRSKERVSVSSKERPRSSKDIERSESRDSKERRLSKDSVKDSSKDFAKDSAKDLQAQAVKEAVKSKWDSKEKKPQASNQKQPEASTEKVEKSLRFEFNYYDPGNHWCKTCNMHADNLHNYFIHLHSKKHMQKCDPYDRPWMTETLMKVKKPTGNTIDAPIRGSEFVMPVNGFFCRLCKQFFGDGVCATEHVKSSQHNKTYEKYTEENNYYERKLKIDKAAARAQQMEIAMRKERELKRKQEGDVEEDEEMSKKQKVDAKEIKMVDSKGQRGFGVFEFNKKDEENNEKSNSDEDIPPESKPEKLPSEVVPQSETSSSTKNVSYKSIPAEKETAKPTPSENPSAERTAAEKKAALAAKLAPMVGKMRGPSKFALRKTGTAKIPAASKLTTQNLFPSTSKKLLTFDTLPVITDKEEESKKSAVTRKLTPSDIADAFGGKNVDNEDQDAQKQQAEVKPVPPSVVNVKAKEEEKPKEESDVFGPALPPQPVSLEDMDEEDVCVPGMDDIYSLPNLLPKPKAPPPVSAIASAPTTTMASASSTARNLYNIFYTSGH